MTDSILHKYLTRLWLSVSVGLGLVLIFVISRLVVKDSTTLPFWDYWTFVTELASHDGHYSLAQLWHQHNEHRIVIPRLLFLVDIHWFHATGRFLLATILITQLLQLGIFCLVIVPLSHLSNAFRAGLCCFVCALLFSPVQLDNFVWGFQVSFILATFFGSLSFYLFAKSYHKSSIMDQPQMKMGLFTGSLIAALLSTLCLASGLFVWPVLVLLCFGLRLNCRVLMSAMLSAILVVSSYLHHYGSPGDHASPIISIEHPRKILEYLALYFGGSWIIYGRHAAAIVGTMGLLAGVALLCHYAFRIRSTDRCRIFCSAVVFFSLMTGFVTALGRVNFGIDQALSSRYQTVTLVFWAALGIWLISLTTNGKMPRWSRFAVLFGLAFIALGPLLRYGAISEPYAARAEQWRVAEVSALSGVNDYFMMKAVCPDPGKINSALAYLRVHRLSVFASSRAKQLGAPFSSVYRLDTKERCEGAMDAPAAAPGPAHNGFRLTGWAWDKTSKSEFRNIVIVNEHGTIAGFGSGGYVYSGKQPDGIADRDIQWFGYVPEGSDLTKLQAYGVVGDGGDSCPVGGTKDVPHTR